MSKNLGLGSSNYCAHRKIFLAYRQKGEDSVTLPRHRCSFLLQFLSLFMLVCSTGPYLEGGEVLQWIILFVLEMPENVNLVCLFFPMNLTPISRDSKVHW